MDLETRGHLLPAADSSVGIDWEETACLSCGCDTWTPLVEAPDRTPGGDGLWFMVVRCQECGLCFTNPRPNFASIARFYRADYPPHQPKEHALQGPHWWRRLPIPRGGEALRKHLPWHGHGRLLDFGCGAGSFLVRMRQQGWSAVGVDASESTVAYLRDQLGLEAFAGSLPHPALEDGSFDVITMWQSLEHVHQPLSVVQAAFHLLAPGGKVIVAVPNIDSLAFRWFGSAWSGLDLPRHLVHFGPATLRLMLHRAGFRVGRARMIRRSGWLRDSARHAASHFPGNNPWFTLMKGKTASNLAGWYAYLTGQADCMMATGTKR